MEWMALLILFCWFFGWGCLYLDFCSDSVWLVEALRRSEEYQQRTGEVGWQGPINDLNRLTPAQMEIFVTILRRRQEQKKTTKKVNWVREGF